MELVIEIAGEVVERQELLNGTQIVTLEGASGDGRWTMSGLFSWNIGLKANAGEGDITLVRDGGGELFGTLASGDVSEAEEGATHFVLRYEIDGGAGEFESASGSVHADGLLAGAGFEATVRVEVAV